MRSIDLNADLGEGMPGDADLLGLITTANLATGAHAGGGPVLLAAASAAAEAGVVIGAHPSYRDREGFGRRSLLAELRASPSARADFTADLIEQITDVADAAARHGQRLGHVKAHGALYNEAVEDRVAAAVVLDAVQAASRALGHDLVVLTQPFGQLASAAAQSGVTVCREGFVDRAYADDGRLMSRTIQGAVLGSPALMAEQAVALAQGWVRVAWGVPGAGVPGASAVLDMPVDSLCLHGDTPGAVAAARLVRKALEDAGWTVTAFRTASAASRGHAADRSNHGAGPQPG